MGKENRTSLGKGSGIPTHKFLAPNQIDHRSQVRMFRILLDTNNSSRWSKGHDAPFGRGDGGSNPLPFPRQTLNSEITA